MKKRFNKSVDNIKLSDLDKENILKNVLSRKNKYPFRIMKLATVSCMLLFGFYIFNAEQLNDDLSFDSSVRSISTEYLWYENVCFVQTNTVVDSTKITEFLYLVNDRDDLTNFDVYKSNSDEECVMKNNVCYLLKKC